MDFSGMPPGLAGGRMVGVAGFEPATPASRTRCSTRLSHTPTARKRLYRGAPPPVQAGARDPFAQALHRRGRCAISPAPEGEPSGLPFLLGNGVMVTLRFLVPSF